MNYCSNLSGFLLQSNHLIQVKTTETACWDLVKGWPQPLNRGDHLIEVKITVIKGSNFQDFDNWPLNRGWPLNTGSIVFLTRDVLFELPYKLCVYSFLQADILINGLGHSKGIRWRPFLYFTPSVSGHWKGIAPDFEMYS